MVARWRALRAGFLPRMLECEDADVVLAWGTAEHVVDERSAPSVGGDGTISVDGRGGQTLKAYGEALPAAFDEAIGVTEELFAHLKCQPAGLVAMTMRGGA